MHVFWKAEDRYFPGELLSLNDKGRWLVKYADGDIGWACVTNDTLEAHLPYSVGEHVKVLTPHDKLRQGHVRKIDPEGFILVKYVAAVAAVAAFATLARWLT